LTEMLEGVGDAVLRSAVDELRQAQQSPRRTERLGNASTTLQTAFSLFEKSGDRGPSRVLRAVVEGDRLCATHEKAADCASAIALIQWVLGEAPGNIREWLTRANRQLRRYDDAKTAQLTRGGLTNPQSLQFFRAAFDGHVRRAYFRLEENILPAADVEERPPWFRAGGLTGAQVLDQARMPHNPGRW
jgi:hypothetical protein